MYISPYCCYGTLSLLHIKFISYMSFSHFSYIVINSYFHCIFKWTVDIILCNVCLLLFSNYVIKIISTWILATDIGICPHCAPVRGVNIFKFHFFKETPLGAASTSGCVCLLINYNILNEPGTHYTATCWNRDILLLRRPH